MSPNIIEWTPYNRGPCILTFLDRTGMPFNGTPEDFVSLHQTFYGLRNKITNVVVLINHFGEVAARTATNNTYEVCL